MLRQRYSKIIATLGPASDTLECIESLFTSGADVFRFNFSHGTHDDHLRRYQYIRSIEQKYNRPIGVIADLQGPKLRVGCFQNNEVTLKAGQKFILDMNQELGTEDRVCLPHAEIYKALEKDIDLLLNDGRIVLRVKNFTDSMAETEIIQGGTLSNRKGLNVPNVHLPISALTPKDLIDLEFVLGLGVDYIGLSFVQTPDDILLARSIIQNKCAILSKLEKPMALNYLDEIIDASDGIMVARGDLGVEMLPEEVPAIQRKIIRSCRKAGKPVIVATQMLESMITNQSPTRAEVSDVATAIYDGVDAVTLSAESASGQYPVESVSIMSRIIARTEQDPLYIQTRYDENIIRPHTITDSIAAAAHQVARTINVQCIVTFSESGFTTLKVARERPLTPILSLTPNLTTSRRMTLVWGVHAALVSHIYSFSQMVSMACLWAKAEGFASTGQEIIVTAGVPFGQAGGTNILRVKTIDEEEI